MSASASSDTRAASARRVPDRHALARLRRAARRSGRTSRQSELLPDARRPAFANGGGSPNIPQRRLPNVLPSFNVRFGLDRRLHPLRLFASDVAAGYRSAAKLCSDQSPVINTSPNSPYVVYNSPTAAHVAANVVGYNFVFQANAGNAGLRPMTADQFDLSFERYMDRPSFTVDGFCKKLTTVAYGQFSAASPITARPRRSRSTVR